MGVEIAARTEGKDGLLFRGVFAAYSKSVHRAKHGTKRAVVFILFVKQILPTPSNFDFFIIL
ncbi:hypothetical protein [Methanosarcina sp.]|uniref:hypothetical protein n=1 Tax=Methanosarcina sp. TaxID=2213 RepID=UPI003C733BC2